MAKLDEIAELLTEELSGFNKSIEKLGKLIKELQSTKVKADTSRIEYHIEDFLDAQNDTKVFYKRQVREIKKSLNKSRITPKWERPVLYLLMTLNILSFAYLGYHFIHSQRQKEAAFIEGKEEGVDLVRGYFRDHPVIYKDFQRWAKKQDSIHNQK